MASRTRGRNRAARVTACLLSMAVFSTACSEDAPSRGLEHIELTELVSVGVLEGRDEEVFGQIDDVIASGDGTFFVLDRQVPSVGWFSLDGAYLGGVRARGEGPGELTRPMAIASSNAASLAVLDPGNGRMNLYTTSSEGLAFGGQVTTTWSAALGSPRSLCSMGDRWYAAGPRDGFILHEISDEGEVRRSFGEVEEGSEAEFGPFLPIAIPQLNTGRLLCLEDLDVLVLVRPFSRRVEAYSGNGEKAWEVEVEEVSPRRLVVNERGLRSELSAEGGSHEAFSLVRWSPGSVIVQYEWRPADREAGWQEGARITSIELRAADGAEAGRSDTLPRITDASGAHVYSAENLPFPRVRVYSRD